jgi:hypothetical protein
MNPDKENFNKYIGEIRHDQINSIFNSKNF